MPGHARLAHPVGAPQAAPATRLQLGHAAASGAHLGQFWSKSGAILEQLWSTPARRGMEDGDASRGWDGWGSVEWTGGHRVSPGPARDVGWVWGTSLPPRSPARCSEPPRGGVMPQLLGGILQGPIPAGTQLAHRAPPPQSRYGQRVSVRAMQTSVAARQRRNTSQHVLRQAGGNCPLPESARAVSGQLH